MTKLLIDDKWVREIHKDVCRVQDKYTFCGALAYRYKHIAKNWNRDTRKKYEKEYNNIILPALEHHNEKTIREYTKEDYEQAIKSIRETGYEKGGIKHWYAESTIHHFENLIYYVVFQASVYGLCDNVLWGSEFEIDFADETGEIESRVMIKKSLSVQQEKQLLSELLEDVSEDGSRVALLLMWGLGLRNAEACGLNYGDIKELKDHKGCYAAWIYKTTKINSRDLQSGGKTYNTGRIVPVPDRIVSFLLDRKKQVTRLISSQGCNSINIDRLPLCNDGRLEPGLDSFIKRCKASQVTSEAHIVFEAAGITAKQVAYLAVELSEDNTAALLKEKEPTAYLLRRNYATQMNILGLSNAEMQYLIGHDVEDAYESRNEFVDEERIYAMSRKLKQRALLNNCLDDSIVGINIQKSGFTKINISVREPAEDLKVSLSGPEEGVKVVWLEEKLTPSYDRTVDILKEYHQMYN